MDSFTDITLRKAIAHYLRDDNNRPPRPNGRGILCGLLLFGTEDVVSTRTVMSPLPTL